MLKSVQSVKGKLGLGFGLILILVCVLGTVSVSSLHKANTITDAMYSNNLRGLRHLAAINTLLGRTQSRALTVLNKEDPEAVATLSSFFSKAEQQVDELFKQYYPSKVNGPQEAAT